MKVLPSGGNVVFHNEKNKKNQASISTEKSVVAHNKPLSFMSIPTLAFLGKLVIPELPDKLKNKPQIHMGVEKTAKFAAPGQIPTVQYKVYPQDPLVTETEIYTLKGEVAPGPVNRRVEVEGRKNSCKPNAEGNFIFDPDSKQFEKANSFVFVNKALNLYENALGRRIYWAFREDKIKVNPRAGNKMSASYNRFDEEIKLFYFKNQFDKKETLYTSKMADVISHEAGHAVLDGLRPRYMNFGDHGLAVHEAFADSTAMLLALSNDNIIDRVIKDTGGNLRKENLIASIGEQFGKAVYGDRLYLRNAINGLKLSHFTSGKIEAEVHIVGLFFDAIFYDILTGMYKLHSEKMTPKEALIKTRDDMTILFARAMGDFMPPSNVNFGDMAVAMVQSDKTDFGGKYRDIIINTLIQRELLSPDTTKKLTMKKSDVPYISLSDFNIGFKPGNFGLTNKNTNDLVQKITGFVNNNKSTLALPAENKYQVENAYTNSRGETFMHLIAPQKVTLPEFDGEKYSIEVSNGLTLAFDKDGKLFYKTESTATQEQIDNAIKDCQQTLNKMKKDQEQNITSPAPGLFKDTHKDNLLVKSPVIEDTVKV